jgi:phosphoglycolate phosphatase
MKRKTVIFDFDGVLHDTSKMAFDICKTIKPNITKEEFESIFDGGVVKNLRIGFSLLFRSKFRKLESKYYMKLKLEKNVKRTLEKLYKNYDLYIITSNTRKNMESFFINSKFHGKFKEIITIETGPSKSRKLKNLLKRNKISRDDCVFITDTLGDIKASKKARVKTIGCTFGYQTLERIKKGSPEKIVSKFEQIPKAIKEII